MDPTSPAPLSGPHDLSFVGLFLQADPVVKSIMVLLALASVACWTIIIERSVRLARLRRAAGTFERAAASDDIGAEPPGAGGRVLSAGLAAWHDRDETESRSERRDRYERAMRGALASELRRLQPGLSFLATTGATAPFVGLFVTVWGIMNSFSSIAQSQDTSLAVVAPGIAEALFATAIGLVAAIPAVVAYNRLTADLSRAQQGFGAGIATLGDRLARRLPPAHDARRVAG